MWAVEICRHCAYEVSAVLGTVRTTELYSRYFCYRIRPIRFFQGSGQKILFFNRLRRFLRVDAGTSEKEKFLYASRARAFHDVCLYKEVVANRLGGPIAVCDDAADFCGGEKDVSGTFLLEKGADGVLICW